MRESSSFNILTRDSDFVSILNQCSKSHSFSSSPIDIFTICNTLGSGLEDLLDQSMEFSIFWKLSDLGTPILKTSCTNTSCQYILRIMLHNLSPFFGNPILGLISESLALSVSLFQFSNSSIFHRC